MPQLSYAILSSVTRGNAATIFAQYDVDEIARVLNTPTKNDVPRILSILCDLTVNPITHVVALLERMCLRLAAQVLSPVSAPMDVRYAARILSTIKNKYTASEILGCMPIENAIRIFSSSHEHKEHIRDFDPNDADYVARILISDFMLPHRAAVIWEQLFCPEDPLFRLPYDKRMRIAVPMCERGFVENAEIPAKRVARILYHMDEKLVDHILLELREIWQNDYLLGNSLRRSQPYGIRYEIIVTAYQVIIAELAKLRPTPVRIRVESNPLSPISAGF